jgi:hypothetical protein
LVAAVVAYYVLTNDADTTENYESESGVTEENKNTSSAAHATNIYMLDLAFQYLFDNAYCFVMPEGDIDIRAEVQKCTATVRSCLACSSISISFIFRN